MNPIEHHCDVAVIGGGPAGAVAARLLAAWGRDVVVVTRAHDAAHDLAVSLPPSIDKLLRQVGMFDAVRAAGFLRSTGNTVWWGGQGRRTESFADGRRGYQVLHSEFDGVLLAAAADAGARVVADVAVHGVEIGADEVRISGESADGALQVTAPLVLDASGRAGVVARRLELRLDVSTRTVALIGTWRDERGWDVPDDSHTLVESFADGWAWSIPVAPGRRYFTCMLDPRVSDTGAGDLGERYAAVLGRAKVFTDLVAGATLEGEPWACDASGYSASKVSGERFLLVGDAASGVDPLSSFGVTKALGSAWLAALVANTTLSDPRLAKVARSLFEEHERRVYETFRSSAAKFFDQGAGDEEHPFWAGRVAVASAAPAVPGEPDIDALRRDPDVLAAFEALKASPSIRLAKPAAVRTIQLPAIGDRGIVMEDHLATESIPEGLRYLRGVDVRRVAELAPDYDQVPDLFEAYNRAATPVPLGDFVGALSVLMAKGILRDRPVC